MCAKLGWSDFWSRCRGSVSAKVGYECGWHNQFLEDSGSRDSFIIKEMISTLTGKNQVTVPAELARDLKLVPGTRLDWMAGDTADTIVIRILPSKRQVLARIQELGGQLRNRKLIEELIEERAGEA